MPLGVLASIYESRPNVTTDIVSLALKSGNACILRGGKETLRSNTALVSLIHRAIGEAGLPTDAVQFVDDTDRALVDVMLGMKEYISLLVPRGGTGPDQLCGRKRGHASGDGRRGRLPYLC